MEQLLSIEAVADLLGVKVLTIRGLRQEGRFAPAVKVGRRLLWQRTDLERWVAAHREADAA